MAKGDGVLLTRIAKNFSDSKLVDGLLDVAGNFAEKQFFGEDDEKQLDEVSFNVFSDLDLKQELNESGDKLLEYAFNQVNQYGLTEADEQLFEHHIQEALKVLVKGIIKAKIVSGEITK